MRHGIFWALHDGGMFRGIFKISIAGIFIINRLANCNKQSCKFVKNMVSCNNVYNVALSMKKPLC